MQSQALVQMDSQEAVAPLVRNEGRDDIEPVLAEAEMAVTRESLLRQFRRLSQIDWSDPDAVEWEDISGLIGMISLPPSWERENYVRLSFGTVGELKRAWRKFSRWAPASFVADVHPAADLT